MSYALYRKYRPQTFSDVIGQEFITETLKHEVSRGTFSHAYLFTGTRGTGKTSCARILARAINCPNAVDGEPCNECDLCRGITEGTLADVTEIDAASNSSVDNIRSMRDEVSYLPVAAPYKVYIIDEVHMLSGAAFNALLKTLEEPPAHAIFILATTEVSKVPATVLSRCQRFDFGRIPVSLIADRIEKIVREENGLLDREGCELVAELGDGSMRDSLSILEKVIRLGSGEELRKVLGVIDRAAVYDMMDSVAEGDFASLCEKIDAFYAASGEPSRLCADMLTEYRNVLLCKSTKDYRRFTERSERDASRIETLAGRMTASAILYAMDLLQELMTSLPRSTNKRADMEVCLLRLSDPRLTESYEALMSRVEALEEKLKNGVVAAPVAPKKTAPRPAEPKPAEKPVAEPEPESVAEPEPESAEEPVPEPVSETSEAPAAPVSEPVQEATDDHYREFLSWQDVCAKVKDFDMMLGLTLSNETSCVYKGTDFLILCGEEADLREVSRPENMKAVREAFDAVRRFTGEYTVRAVLGNKGMYIEDTSLYDNADSNELFTFDDQ